jgi:hypothetical protein
MAGCPPANRSLTAGTAILETCLSSEDIFFLGLARLPLLARLRPAGARWDRRQPHAQRAVPDRP